MNLTPKLADKIAARYGRVSLNCHGTHEPVEAALAEVIRRAGGLCAALNEDARRDLILTLGDHCRANERCRARSRKTFAAVQERLSTPLKHAAE